MRAARVCAPRKLQVEEVPVPEMDAGEVRVQVEACGICGTDLSLLGGGLLPVGCVPGHEMAGVIEAAGHDSDCPPPGTRVAVEPLRSCGDCVYCRSGRYNICRDFEVHGIHRAGGFAEQVVVPAERVHPVDPELAPAVAALAEPMAVAVHGLRRGSFEKEQRVLVLGSGAVGLVSLLAARGMGAGEVWISARYAHQAERARQLGATRVLSEQEASPAALAELGVKTDFDLVVETVGGGANTLQAACAAIRPGGSISVLGMFTGPVAVEPYALLMKEGNLAWSNCYNQQAQSGADFATAVELVEGQREPLASLLSHRFPLERVAEGFQVASNKLAGALKVSVLPRMD
jgi:2-desacetyl-2-hydroxyethyl bacteriochlorophyllide A dehydrogenase